MVFIEGAVDFSIALCSFYGDLYGVEGKRRREKERKNEGE
jgi:hypothetical protein